MIEFKPIALFDMDGTLCDYVQSMKLELQKMMSPKEKFIDPFKTGNNPEYEYLWNRMALIKSDKEWWANLPKYKFGFDILEMTSELGYENEILTQTPKDNPSALAGKLEWIVKNIEGHMDYTMTQNKSRHYGRVFVDDYPGFLIPWLKHRKKGLCIMPVNEYNKDFQDPRVLHYDGRNKDQIYDALIKAKA